MEQKASEKIIVGSQVGKAVACSMCGKQGTTDQFFAMRSKKGTDLYLCSDCKEKTNKAFAAETKDVHLVRGIVFGIVAGVLGGFVWYFAETLTEMQFGYISLGLGYLIGFGVWWGAGKKRGENLQIISAVITLLSIVVTEKYAFDFFVNQYIQAHLDQYPNAAGHVFSASFFDPGFWQSMVSPIGLLIYAIGIYVAYRYCKPRRM